MIRSWAAFGLLALSLAGCAQAAEVAINQKPDSQEQCSGMYSRKSWGGNIDPYIDAMFLPYKPPEAKEGQPAPEPISDPTVAFILFEWADNRLIGVPNRDDPAQQVYVCDQSAIEGDYCNQDQYGSFILAANASTLSNNMIVTKAIHTASANLTPIEYPITKTGYYCILTTALNNGLEYNAVAEFRNAYGELPGAQIAKLPFYGGLALVYAVIGLYWAFLYVQNRHDILPVQNYITATIVFLIFEMITTWGYYDHMNRKGADVMSKVLLILDSVLNAARNSISFFLLLIVCLGYGVVKSNLGRKMLFARILAGTHFVFGVIYAIASLSIAPEDVGPLILLVVLPLAGSLTAFYIWTLNALAWTLKDLQERKQRIKAQMYRKLWYCIVATILVIFAFFFFNSFTFANANDPNYTPRHWQTRWFVLDGWLNLVYLADVAFIAYLWRPTANNRRFAMSEEISQEDEGFEIANMRDSLDFDALDGEDDDEELGRAKAPAYDPSPNNKNYNNKTTTSNTPATTTSTNTTSTNTKPQNTPTTSTSHTNNDDDDDSDDDLPLSAPTPQRPAQIASVQREAVQERRDRDLDGSGEAMFAVGEDEEDADDVRGFSDSEEEGDGRGLVGRGR